MTLDLRRKEKALRELASRLIFVVDEVALRGAGGAKFLYVIGNRKSAEVSWDENDRLWSEFWGRLDEDAEVESEETFLDIKSAEKGILRKLRYR